VRRSKGDGTEHGGRIDLGDLHRQVERDVGQDGANGDRAGVVRQGTEIA